MKKVQNLIVGDGWAALASAGLLAQAGQKVRWLAGTGSRLVSPLPVLEQGQAARVWRELASRLGVDPGSVTSGSFLREFKNKSFRQAPWTRCPEGNERRDAREEALWAPELRAVPDAECRFEHSPAELEEQFRSLVMALPGVERELEIGIQEFRTAAPGEGVEVVLTTGEALRAERVIFADRWNTIPVIQGLPKPIPFLRGREPMGALQALFNHSAPVGADRAEGFYGPIQREAGEEFQRNLVGHFFDDGRKSVWTLFMGSDEGEDNHEITKRLRRLKQALDKMFTGESWLPAGKAEFMATVTSEQVRFEEAVVFSAGDTVQKPESLPKLPGVFFLTDGAGLSASLEQVGELLGQELGFSPDEMPLAESAPIETTPV